MYVYVGVYVCMCVCVYAGCCVAELKKGSFLRNRPWMEYGVLTVVMMMMIGWKRGLQFQRRNVEHSSRLLIRGRGITNTEKGIHNKKCPSVQ